MKRFLHPLCLVITLAVGIYIGAGLGAAQQLRLDIARFSENVRDWHKRISVIDGVPQRVKDDPLFTLQGLHMEQNGGLIDLSAFSPVRFFSILGRTEWESTEK